MGVFADKVKAGLSELKILDPNHTLFGANDHHYELGAPLQEEELQDFEKACDCKLPSAYREFLTLAGNGGAGPSYGVNPFGTHEGSPWPDFIKPEMPFPFTQAHNDTSILSRYHPEEQDFNTTEEFEEACDIWANEHEEDFYRSYCKTHLITGAIPIVHHGCALSSWLVIAEGGEYGFIWEDHVADHEGVFPFGTPNQERFTFDQWYLAWLEDALANTKNKTRK